MLLGTGQLDDADVVFQALLNNLADCTTSARTPEISYVLVEEAVSEENDPSATLVTYLVRPGIRICHAAPWRMEAGGFKYKFMMHSLARGPTLHSPAHRILPCSLIVPVIQSFLGDPTDDAS